jgi:hypothetical protein
MADAPKLVGGDKLWQMYPKVNQGIDNANAALNLLRGSFVGNKGESFPLKNMTFKNTTGTISTTAKNAILDAKVFGAKVDCYYMLTFIANGYVSQGKPRYGITLLEYRKSDFSTVGFRTNYVFIYNDDVLAGNQGNANYVKTSETIETITVDNGTIACSVTIDRTAFSGAEFLNLSSNHAPTAIIDPANYFF